MATDDILWKQIDKARQTKKAQKDKPVKKKTTKPQSGGDDTVIPRHHDTMTPRNHDTMIPSMVETLRKAVKVVGKEAATHRFTKEEKLSIADIVYTYGRKGYTTSENELVRIAINWLVLDYKQNGEKSILHEVTRALKE